MDDRFIHYVIYYIGLFIEIIRKMLYCRENVSYPKHYNALAIQDFEKLSGSNGHLMMDEIGSEVQGNSVVFAASNRSLLSNSEST